MNTSIFFVLIFALAAFPIIHSHFELSNVQCVSYDKDYSDFEYCYLKSVNRSYKFVSAKIHFLQLPINNGKINFSLNKRANGYKPFLYNITVDVCKYFKASIPNPVVKYFYQVLLDYSNINHTCPFNHDLILDKLDINYLNHHFTERLPMPEGDYGIFITGHTDNKLRGSIMFYFKISY